MWETKHFQMNSNQADQCIWKRIAKSKKKINQCIAKSIAKSRKKKCCRTLWRKNATNAITKPQIIFKCFSTRESIILTQSSIIQNVIILIFIQTEWGSILNKSTWESKGKVRVINVNNVKWPSIEVSHWNCTMKKSTKELFIIANFAKSIESKEKQLSETHSQQSLWCQAKLLYWIGLQI